MRLTRGVRFGLGLVTIVLLSAGGVGAALKWSDVALTTFIVAGVFVLIGAVVGVFPKGSFKEGSIEWPEVDKHPRVEAIEGEVAALRAQETRNTAAIYAELEKVQAQAQQTAELLADYILAQEPEPDDGMLPDERLRDLEGHVEGLSMEITGRYMTEEYYDDGIGVEKLEEWRDKQEADLRKEERRQAARARFRLPLGDEQSAKHES